MKYAIPIVGAAIGGLGGYVFEDLSVILLFDVVAGIVLATIHTLWEEYRIGRKLRHVGEVTMTRLRKLWAAFDAWCEKYLKANKEYQ